MKKLLPQRFYEVLERAGICTSKEILLLSVWDIQKLTKLNIEDIFLIKSIVANHKRPQTLSGNELCQYNKVSSGCSSIDELLKGGFRRGTITEIYGESGSGKTQITINCSAHNCGGTLFINTEGLYPIKRYNQICNSMSLQISKRKINMYVEHLTESKDLLSCIRVRLQNLLNQSEISLLIIDSVAAPFRCEYQNYVPRAEDLKDLAMLLYNAAQKYNLAVICLNQVTASLDYDNVLPTLGLVWSNMVTYRFQVRKTNNIYNAANIRELLVIHAPDLPNKETLFSITSKGIEDISHV